MTTPGAPSELTTRSVRDTRFVHNIRLWGKDGQEALENTHILALGCTSLTCQSIKNLVLPGAGTFTLVDDRKITLEDAQTNFFLSNVNGSAQKKIGEYLVDAAKVSLVDLHRPNEETGGVNGNTIIANPNEFVTKSSFGVFLKEKNVNVVLVAASVVSNDTIASLASVIEGDKAFARVLVLVLHISGYIGAIRMSSVRDATIVKSVKPSDETFDNRYSDPFPALRQWMDTHYPDMVHEAERTRIPFFVLAYHAIVSYNEKHVPSYSEKRNVREGSQDFAHAPPVPLKLPNDTKEWQQAQACLRNDVCTIEIKGNRFPCLDEQDETFGDAMLLLTRAKGDLRARSVPELKRTWDRADEIIAAQKGEAELFWFVAKGIQAFQKNNNGHLPLSTEIPDFHTNTDWYRELVGIYRTESAREAKEVFDTTKALLAQYNKTVDDETLKATCDRMVPNARYLAVTSYVPLSNEYVSSTPSNASTSPSGVILRYSPEEGLHDPCGWYIALKVAHRFASAEGRFPGSVNTTSVYEADQRSLVAKFTSEPTEFTDLVDPDCNWVSSKETIMSQIEEVVRGGGGELITTAAIVGALAAQEVIKYVQQRYIPAGSLIVFDGHESLTHCVGVAAK